MEAQIRQIRDEVERLVGPFPPPPAAPSTVSTADLASLIDHTLLKPDGTPEQVVALCREAREHHFASVCVNPSYVRLCVEQLEGSGIPVAAVVGFPLGAMLTRTKAEETRHVVAEGAREIDMVLHVGRLLAGEWRAVHDDIYGVVEAAGPDVHVKVILENCLLDERGKIAGCLLSVAAGAHFVKTSTGFSKSGATVEDVRLMRAVVGPGIGVKAAGGIRTRGDAEAMVAAGANRLGCSASAAIVTSG